MANEKYKKAEKLLKSIRYAEESIKKLDNGEVTEFEFLSNLLHPEGHIGLRIEITDYMRLALKDMLKTEKMMNEKELRELSKTF